MYFSISLMIDFLLRFHISNGISADLPLVAFDGFNHLKILDLHGRNINNLKKGQSISDRGMLTFQIEVTIG